MFEVNMWGFLLYNPLPMQTPNHEKCRQSPPKIIDKQRGAPLI
ncbi:hypothetical protein FHS19_005888 [Paenibacillus rhizosphaerae]|uniref:Uncharacterized protein n=1 Tax=Paenibacillus rhizosphaerae TaxID=297318 RepID=A0A839U0K1_9BACL|nr:hypothetical protein [Paenibacillus rhizosphaerae]